MLICFCFFFVLFFFCFVLFFFSIDFVVEFCFCSICSRCFLLLCWQATSHWEKTSAILTVQVQIWPCLAAQVQSSRHGDVANSTVVQTWSHFCWPYRLLGNNPWLLSFWETPCKLTHIPNKQNQKQCSPKRKESLLGWRKSWYCSHSLRAASFTADGEMTQLLIHNVLAS